MEFIGNRREKFNIYNSLVNLAVSLEKRNVIIDLRDESTVAGFLDNIDGYLNVNLTNAVVIDCMGLQYGFDEIMISKRKIRYIHIPAEVNIMENIELQLNRMKRKPREKTKKKTFKQIRREEMHKFTLNEIANKKS